MNEYTEEQLDLLWQVEQIAKESHSYDRGNNMGSWKVSLSPGGSVWGFETHSPTGEDVIFTCFGTTLEALARDACRVAEEEFDPEEHAGNIYHCKKYGTPEERRFFASAPDSLRMLLDDADKIDIAQRSLAYDLCKAAGIEPTPLIDSVIML